MHFYLHSCCIKELFLIIKLLWHILEWLMFLESLVFKHSSGIATRHLKLIHDVLHLRKYILNPLFTPGIPKHQTFTSKYHQKTSKEPVLTCLNVQARAESLPIINLLRRSENVSSEHVSQIHNAYVPCRSGSKSM